MENETREVTYIAVSLILVAVVLNFLMYGIGLVRNLAQTRNNDVTANRQIVQFREYNAYDGQTLNGDQVIELILSKYDQIEIYCDYRENAKTTSKVTATTSCSLCRNCDTPWHTYFSAKMYDIHAGTTNDYFIISPDLNNADGNDLRNWFPTESKYRAYLTYNNANVRDTYFEIMSNYNHVLSGYDDSLDGKLRALDSWVKPEDPTSIVTGIVLISYATLGID